jgi:hypothetical protein
MMVKFSERREKVQKWAGQLVPSATEKLQSVIRDGRRLVAYPSDQHTGLVTDLEGNDFIIRIDVGTCSCGKFQEFDFPCKHVAAFALSKGQDPVQYVGGVYTVEHYKRTYEQAIPPIVASQLQTLREIRPPMIKRGRGRPRKLRIRHSSEIEKKRLKHCSLCKQAGHTRKRCKKPPS